MRKGFHFCKHLIKGLKIVNIDDSEKKQFIVNTQC